MGEEMDRKTMDWMKWMDENTTPLWERYSMGWEEPPWIQEDSFERPWFACLANPDFARKTSRMEDMRGV